MKTLVFSGVVYPVLLKSHCTQSLKVFLRSWVQRGLHRTPSYRNLNTFQDSCVFPESIWPSALFCDLIQVMNHTTIPHMPSSSLLLLLRQRSLWSSRPLTTGTYPQAPHSMRIHHNPEWRSGRCYSAPWMLSPGECISSLEGFWCLLHLPVWCTPFLHLSSCIPLPAPLFSPQIFLPKAPQLFTGSHTYRAASSLESLLPKAIPGRSQLCILKTNQMAFNVIGLAFLESTCYC